MDLSPIINIPITLLDEKGSDLLVAVAKHVTIIHMAFSLCNQIQKPDNYLVKISSFLSTELKTIPTLTMHVVSCN